MKKDKNTLLFFCIWVLSFFSRGVRKEDFQIFIKTANNNRIYIYIDRSRYIRFCTTFLSRSFKWRKEGQEKMTHGEEGKKKGLIWEYRFAIYVRSLNQTVHSVYCPNNNQSFLLYLPSQSFDALKKEKKLFLMYF